MADNANDLTRQTNEMNDRLDDIGLTVDTHLTAEVNVVSLKMLPLRK